jgi:hypothetical protein
MPGKLRLKLSEIFIAFNNLSFGDTKGFRTAKKPVLYTADM